MLTNTVNDSNIDMKCELTSDIIGPSLYDLIRLCSGSNDDDVIKNLSSKFKKCYDSVGYKDTMEFPYIYNALTDLTKNNFKLYIATNKRIIPTMKIINFLKWNKFFEGVYALDSFAPEVLSKSDIISKIILQNNLDVENVIYVGDLEADRKAANICNVKFLMAGWGYNNQVKSKNYYLGSPSQLYRAVNCI